MSTPQHRPGNIGEARRADTTMLLRALTLTMLYSGLLAFCRYIAYEIRFDFVVPPEFQAERLLSVSVSLPIKLGFLLLFRQFGSLLTYFSVPDLMRIAAAMACANLAGYLLHLGITPSFLSPRGVVLIDFVLAVGALSLMRLGFRIYRERYANVRPLAQKAARRIAILGAGDAGATLAGEAIAKPHLGLRPVFFLDDDQQKHGRDIHGVPVLGAPEEIVHLRKRYPIDSCVLAMPSAPTKRLQEIFKLLSAEGLRVEIVPSLAELTSGRVKVSKIRPVQVEDLLGREQVDLKNPAVAELLLGKTVLVTGAGGSIGAELCRQVAGYHPKRLLLVEQAEGSLFHIEGELNERGYEHTLVPLVADVTDLPRMRGILARHRPDVIFHAAAHKHVYMMERQPAEAVKNNTRGTRELAALASELGVGAFVLISTDKAINPTSAMGASKRLAEMHVQAIQQRPGNATMFSAVRFGNVLGSSGSVIPIFKQQIAAGGPVTVTHPEVTRYFMTIPEAVGLVLQTAVLARGGELFVLDMGKPVKIAELARQLIELSGLRPETDIEIKYVGLRPGEKLFEELQHGSEQLRPTSHPRILLMAAESAPPFGWVQRCIAEVEEPAGELAATELKLRIKALVPEYQPHLD